MLLSFVLPLIVLGGLTVVIAGTIASLLVFRSMETRPMSVTGTAGVLLANPLVAFAPVPPIVRIQLNAVTVYPVWAIILAMVVAILWRVGAALAGPEPSPADKEAERVRKARARAARYRQ
jgi:hypothetical protein